MSKFSAIDFKYRVFRCFAVYNCNTQTVILQIQRQCGNLFQETIMKVKDFVKLNLQDSQRSQLFISTGDRSEWHGILEEKSNCYFLMMTFPGSQQAEVRSSLLDLQFTVMGVNNYSKYQDENFPKQKKEELMLRLDDLEKKYVAKFNVEGQPNEDEIGNKNQGSKVTDQFLISKPLNIHPSKAPSKIKEPYRKYGVYRCFMVFNVLNNKILFLQKRGTNRSYTETEGQLTSKLKTQINETTKFDFYMQGNIRSEWHGILDEQKSCYFLMMTFPSSSQKYVREALSDLKKTITSYPNYDRTSQIDLEKRFKTEISKFIDNLEIKYHTIVDNEGVPSEEESKLRDTFIQSNPVVVPNQQQTNQNNKIQQSSKISLNPPIFENEDEGFDPPQNIGGSSKKLLETTEMNIQKEVKMLESFKPNAQDAIKFLFAGIGFSFIIFTVLLVDLYS